MYTPKIARHQQMTRQPMSKPACRHRHAQHEAAKFSRFLVLRLAGGAKTRGL